MQTEVELAVPTLRTIVSSGASWVLFEQGTVLFLNQPVPDLAASAISLLRQHGPVNAGSASGDFGVIELPENQGWIVSYDFPDMLTLVLPQEGQGMDDLTLGLLGRAKRSQDAEELRVVHIEDRSIEGR
jgi:hypothetical protein